MKSCLKCVRTPARAAPPPEPVAADMSAAAHGRRKHVSFDDARGEEVFLADEWDRSPIAHAKALSYSDMLELRNVYATLPYAEQAPETAAYMPRARKLAPCTAEPARTTSARDMFKAVPRERSASAFVSGAPSGTTHTISARDMFAKHAHPPAHADEHASPVWRHTPRAPRHLGWHRPSR